MLAGNYPRGGVAPALVALILNAPAHAHDSTADTQTQVVLLGTGNPPADPDRSGPATAIVVNGTPYLVDFGAGVVRRAKSAVVDRGIAALDPVKLRVVFVTHLHSDHTVGYPDLILTPWVLGRRVPLEVYGPSGIAHMTRARAGGVQRRLRDAHQGSRAVHGRRVPRRPRRERARDQAGRRLQGCERHGHGVRDQACDARATAIASIRRTAAS